MSNKFMGAVRGVVYPLVAVGLSALLSKINATGWFTTSGSLVLTGIVGWIDHKFNLPTA